ncbi:MAG TPA: helix-turn-helix transcriptional regulator [Opitutaceae bacterium]|nr:helix-turn-helix transcriptional regulator [Opitutaceae bacterium]
MTHTAKLAEKPHQLTLAEWASLHSHLVWAYDGAVSPEGRRGQMHSEHLTAWLIRQGSVKVTQNGHTYRAGKGEWLFPPAGDRWQSFSDNARILSLRFRATWPTGEDLFRNALDHALPEDRYPELLRAAVPLVKFVQTTFPDYGNHLMQAPADLQQHVELQSLFSRWLQTVVATLTNEGLLPSRMGTMDPRLLTAVRALDAAPINVRIPETKLAAFAGLSVSQLNRLFQRQFGVTSLGYSVRRRSQHAHALLEATSRSVKEIAFELGFSSLPHFSAWFRRYHGVSPRALRRKTVVETAPRRQKRITLGRT